MSGTVPHSCPTRRLPNQPSLEQLRSQAKDFLEQYRAGDPAVDGANIARFDEAVQAGDAAKARVLWSARPELVAMDMADNDELGACHSRFRRAIGRRFPQFRRPFHEPR